MKTQRMIAFIIVLTLIISIVSPSYAATFGDWEYTVLNRGSALNDATCRIDKYTFDLGSHIAVPNKINGHKVVELSGHQNTINSQFYGVFPSCTTDVILPETVKKLGNYAFYGCYKLLSVTIPESVSEIGEYAFFECTQLKNIVIPDGVMIIKKGTFFNDKALSSVLIPKSVTEIEDNAFRNCSSLSKVYYGGSEEEWHNIKTSAGNEILENCTVICDYSEKSLPTEPMLGDANADGAVNIKDIISVMRCITGYSSEEICFDAADVSRDGKLGCRDVIMLMKLISK